MNNQRHRFHGGNQNISQRPNLTHSHGGGRGGDDGNTFQQGRRGHEDTHHQRGFNPSATRHGPGAQPSFTPATQTHTMNPFGRGQTQPQTHQNGGRPFHQQAQQPSGFQPRPHGPGRPQGPPQSSEEQRPACTFFNTPGGCSRGESCRFAHIREGPGAAAGFAPTHGQHVRPAQAQPQRPDNRSTKPCIHFARGNCNKGDACPFLHDAAAAPARGAGPSARTGAGAAPQASAPVLGASFVPSSRARGAPTAPPFAALGAPSLPTLGAPAPALGAPAVAPAFPTLGAAPTFPSYTLGTQTSSAFPALGAAPNAPQRANPFASSTALAAPAFHPAPAGAQHTGFGGAQRNVFAAPVAPSRNPFASRATGAAGGESMGDQDAMVSSSMPASAQGFGSPFAAAARSNPFAQRAAGGAFGAATASVAASPFSARAAGQFTAAANPFAAPSTAAFPTSFPAAAAANTPAAASTTPASAPAPAPEPTLLDLLFPSAPTASSTVLTANVPRVVPVSREAAAVWAADEFELYRIPLEAPPSQSNG